MLITEGHLGHAAASAKSRAEIGRSRLQPVSDYDSLDNRDNGQQRDKRIQFLSSTEQGDGAWRGDEEGELQSKKKSRSQVHREEMPQSRKVR